MEIKSRYNFGERYAIAFVRGVKLLRRELEEGFFRQGMERDYKGLYRELIGLASAHLREQGTSQDPELETKVNADIGLAWLTA